MGKGKKRKIESNHSKGEDENVFNLPAKHLAKSHIRSNEKRLIVILDGAQLETVKVNILIFTYNHTLDVLENLPVFNGLCFSGGKFV